MSQSGPPPGWIRTTLGAITQPKRERVIARDARGRGYVGLEDVQRDTGRLISTLESEGVIRSDKTAFTIGDVLYARLRPNLNKVWRATSDGACSTEFIVLRRLRGVDPDFLALRLLADDVVTFATASSSSSLYPRVSYEALSKFELDLPPLAEQARIARKIRSLLDRLEEAQANLIDARMQADAYRRSLLERAFTGELTRDWRGVHPWTGDSSVRLSELGHAHAEELVRREVAGGQGNNTGRSTRSSGQVLPSVAPLGDHMTPTGWLHVPWALVGFAQNGRAFPSSQYSDEGVRLLRPGNLAPDGTINWTEAATRHLPEVVAARNLDLRVGPGEIIMNLTAQSLKDDFLGRVCMTGEGDDCILNQRLARLDATGVAPRFLLYALQSPRFRRFVESLPTGSLIQHMSTRQLAEFVLPIPPETEQDQIVERLDAALAAVAAAEALADEMPIRIGSLRRAILSRAAAGELVRHDPEEGTAEDALKEVTEALAELDEGPKGDARGRRRRTGMAENGTTRKSLSEALAGLGPGADARALYEEAGYNAEDVARFYEEILSQPALLDHFRALGERGRQPLPVQSLTAAVEPRLPGQRFRLIYLWLSAFKNLRNYGVHFDPERAIDIVLGWNGTGKSNLFEALVVIFRDLLMARGKLPATTFGYVVRYEIGGRTVEVAWTPEGKRQLTAKATRPGDKAGKLGKIGRDEVPLPRFVFGYYSGPTNRMAEHFLPLDREHYHRLVDSTSDDPVEILRLFDERRFFCAGIHHAKYVMLGYFHKEDELIARFLRERLRIVGFGAAVFVIRKPDWARPGEDANTFWGATGVVRHFLERLRRIALAPLRVYASIDDGYRQTREEQLHFLIPDTAHLRLLADEYPDARTFFLALESADFSRMVREVKVSVVVDGEEHVRTPITFREMSEGEQQLLTVLGLLRFTRSHDSLVLLDEPDTHLNPHWSVDYLDLLGRIMNDGGQDLGTSQILMSTHDPLVIVAQEKEQIHLLRRTEPEGRCEWRLATENPKGLGFTGILTSEMFGFGSDLDRPTLELLHAQAALAGKDRLTEPERAELERVTTQVEELGFRTASSDPYYRAFLQALARRPRATSILHQQFLDHSEMDELATETDRILAELEAEDAAKVTQT